MKREEVEICPYCMGENILQWDVEKDGYKTNCQHCGKEMMLCDACRHSDDNEKMMCDWIETTGCWRDRKIKRYGKGIVLNQDLLNIIATYMDDDKREAVHFKFAECTPEKFLIEYLKIDPEFKELLETEFSIEVIL